MTERGRLTAVLFGGSALGTIGYILAITVTAIVAAEISGSARWSGVPAAAATLGSAAASPTLSRIMARSGRRPGLVGGMTLAATGTGIGAAATVLSSFAVLIVGSFALGFGRAAYQLARYAAADMRPSNQRAAAIGWIVWAGTIGSVVGPNLLGPTSELGEALLGAQLAGPFVAASLVFALGAIGWFALLRPDPNDLVVTESSHRPGAAKPLRELVKLRNVWVAASAMWLGQYAMVQVMAMTPVFLSSIGETLVIVGGVISAHTFGMFVLSPFTGWLTSRIGPRRVIAAGVGLLLIAVSLGFAGSDGTLAILYPALFLLGVGWNFTFVAGSTLLIEGLDPAESIQLQGLADSGVWISSGTASVLAGIILEGSGFAVLNVVAGSLALLPLVALAVERTERRASSLMPEA